MAKTPGEQYLETMGGLTPPPAATMADYQSEADRLSFLAPAPQRQSIYDLASDLSAGLAAQAASGQPASIGYGLTAGFNTFSKNSQALRKQTAAVKQQIMLKAYEAVENRRSEQKAIQAKAADYDFKAQLEAIKTNGGFFEGNSLPAKSWNYILSKVDPSTNDYKMVPDGKGGMVKYNPDDDVFYRTSKKILEQPKTQIINEPGKGNVSIQTPGFNVDATLNLNKSTQPPPPREGDTIVNEEDGSKWKFNGGDPNDQNNWSKVSG